MLTLKAFVATVLATAASVDALSSGCTAQIAGMAFSGDLAECLQLGGLLPIITSGGSIINGVNSYLTQLCASSTPQCSNSTLTSAESSISSACSQDLQSGGTDGAEIKALQQLLMHYDNVYTAGCAKNTTTNQFCNTSTLSEVQNSTGTDLSVSFLTGLLSGTGNGTQELEQSFSSGRLCTGCVQTIYQQAVQANSTISNGPIASSLSQTCGSNFIGSVAPSDVQAGNPSGASSAAATTSGAAGSAFALPSVMPIILGGIVMIIGAAAGGSLVL